MRRLRSKQSFIIDTVKTRVGLVPHVSSKLSAHDHWGTFKARWGVGRMKYAVAPGLYAIGEPDASSPVLVTANYKMSFDSLRSALRGRSAWILVLDTHGINVWCAAGKGTFGTQNLVNQLEAWRVRELVDHRTLILPQLAGPGVSAHEVKRLSGFQVVYGPVRASDLSDFLDTGNKGTPKMRRKTFDLWERIVLIPMELVDAFKVAAWVIPVFVLCSGFGGAGAYWSNVATAGIFAAFALTAAIVAGTVLTPIFLPWLPGRAFSAKGLVPAVIIFVLLAIVRADAWKDWPGRLEMCGWFLLVSAISTYLAMNFTGASTYTSLSGVKKEMRCALPLQIIGAAMGVLLWLTARLSM